MKQSIDGDAVDERLSLVDIQAILRVPIMSIEPVEGILAP